MKYYTQNDEEQIILDYFKGRNTDELTVLDIGANDGITFSNSKKVIEMGWHGCLVEPSPRAFERLLSIHGNNQKVRCHQVAICENNGMFELQESDTMLNEGDVSLVSSLIPQETVKWANNNVRFTPVRVIGMDFYSFKLMSEREKFNLISIDIEGVDYEVLKQIDLNEVGCEMLIVEFNGREKQKYTDYVLPFGFKLISENPENLIFAK